MNKIALLAVALLIGCAGIVHCEEGDSAINRSPFSFMQSFVMGNEYVEHQGKLSKLEDSYKKGEISKEKYLEMKSDLENEYKAAGASR